MLMKIKEKLKKIADHRTEPSQQPLRRRYEGNFSDHMFRASNYSPSRLVVLQPLKVCKTIQ